MSKNGGRPLSQKDKVICNHCGYNGRIVDKCYKIHEYPPSWKSVKAKNLSSGIMNQVSSYGLETGSDDPSQLSTLQEQCQELIALLQCTSDSKSVLNQSNLL